LTGQPTAAGSGLDRWVAAVRRADRELFVRTARKHSPVLDRVLPALSGAADNAVLELALAATLAAVGGRRWRRAAAVQICGGGRRFCREITKKVRRGNDAYLIIFKRNPVAEHFIVKHSI